MREKPWKTSVIRNKHWKTLEHPEHKLENLHKNKENPRNIWKTPVKNGAPCNQTSETFVQPKKTLETFGKPVQIQKTLAKKQRTP